LYAQDMQITNPRNLGFDSKNSGNKEILISLNQLFVDLDSNLTKSKLVEETSYSENLFLLKQVKEIKNSVENSRRELINFYAVDSNRFMLKIAIYEDSSLRAIVSLIANVSGKKISFSSPINYRTRFWKDKTIGNVHYFYQGSLNKNTAKEFDKKNTEIAEKFEMPVKKLKYYKCLNYDEVQRILGIDFDAKSAGTVQSSEAFDSTIITGVNTENFKHDVFHMYIETKFPDSKDRNFIAEEGYANSIADAYYAKNNGQIISRHELVGYLDEYLANSPDADLLKLFRENPRVYYQLSTHVTAEVFGLLSVRSTITSLICDEVEREKGVAGLVLLLRSGKSEDNFFLSLEKSIGLTTLNFNEKVRKFIIDYK